MTFRVTEVDAIFAAAVELSSPDERAEYIRRVCGENADLQQRVSELLVAHFQAGDFLERPPATVLYRDGGDIQAGPGTIIGPYKLLQQIGEGGMGVVFMAEQREPIHRTVALKIIKPGMDTRQVIARFEAERQALAMMDHPSIAKVLDAGTTETGRPYFVMDLVKGVPITEYCDQQYLTIRQRLELMTQVCHAVQHAHQKGIIHRDIKPSNVLVAEYDGRPVPKIIDFGVAKATAQRLTERTVFTQYGQIVGTFEYMSPEQSRFNQLDVDTRSDIYSLGVLLYELLAGSTPLEKGRLRSAAFDEILRIISEEDPPRPSTRLSSSEALPSIAANRHTEPARLSKDVRGELDWIVMKCLEKDRNRRYETANGLAIDLSHYLHDEAVTACPPSAVYRFRKFARRNRVRLSIAGLMLLPLLLLAGGVAWSARDRAVRQATLKLNVNSALADVESWSKRQNWTEALSAVKRAEGLLAAGVPSPVQIERVREWRKELNAVIRLEEIRLGTFVNEWDSGEDWPALEAEFQNTFSSLGIDIDATPREENAQRVRARPIRGELITALDDWTKLRIFLVVGKANVARNKPDGWWANPLFVAYKADTHEFCNRVRVAVGQQDQAALRELVQSPDAARLPTATLDLLLGKFIPFNVNDIGLEVELLKRAQRAHPDDFFINFSLAVSRPNAYERESNRFYRGKIERQAKPENDLLLGDDAVIYATVAVALRPHNPAARTALGAALERAGRLDEALEAYRDAIRLEPERWNVYDSIGFVLYQQGKLDEAIAIWHKLIDRQPDSFRTFTHIGMAMADQGKFDEAVAAYRKAIEINPNAFSTYQNLGNALSNKAKYDEAIDAYRKVLKLKPHEAAAYLGLGYALGKQGAREEAVAAYRKSIELAPTVARTYAQLGIVLANQGKLDEAVAAYRKSIELDPNYYDSYTNLGTTLAKQGKLDEAIAAYRKLIELQPDSWSAYHNLGYALATQEKFDEARSAFQQAIDLKPDEAHSYSALAQILTKLGRSEEAIAACRKAVELKSNNFVVYNQLSWFLATAPAPQRDAKRAVELASLAVELAKENGEAWNTLGIARYRAGEWQAAIEALNKSTELRNGGDAYDWFILAMCNWQLGHKEEAHRWYEKAVELMDKSNPKDEELSRFRAEAADLLGTKQPQLSTDSSDQPQSPKR